MAALTVPGRGLLAFTLFLFLVSPSFPLEGFL